MAQTVHLLAHHHDPVGYLHDMYGTGKFLALHDLSGCDPTMIISKAWAPLEIA